MRSTALAYDQPTAEDPGERDVYVLAVDGSREVQVAAHRRNDEFVGWSLGGTRLLFASERTGSPHLWAQSIAGLEPIDAPRLVPSEFRGKTMGVTRDGALYYLAASHERSSFLTAAFDFDRGVVTDAASDPGEEFFSINAVSNADWSPDGKWLALSRRDRGGPVGVLVSVLGVDGKRAWDVRPRLRQFGPVRWWPDSVSFVAGGTDLKGRGGVFRIDAHTGLATPVFLSSEGDAIPYMTAISPDGATLYYRQETTSAVGILARDMASGAERVVLSQSRATSAPPSVLTGLSLSPDGAWIATSTKASANGDATLRAVSVATGESRELLGASNASAQVLMWAPDSRSLFVRRWLAGGTPEVLRIPMAGGDPSTVTWAFGNHARGFRVHPDGRRLVFVETPPEGTRGRAELRVLAGIAR